MARIRERLDKHRKLRLARQYARAYRANNPRASAEEIRDGVKSELQKDYPDEFGAGFDWVTFLPQLLEFIKTILDLFTDEDE